MDEFHTQGTPEEDLPEEVSFNAGFGEDKPSSKGYQAQLVSEKLDRLGHKLTLVSIVVLCIILAAAFFIFFDYQNRINKVAQTGNEKVSGLSKDLQADIGGLTQKMDATANGLGQKVTSMNRAVEENKRALAGARRSIESLGQQLKAVSGQQQASGSALEALRKKSDDSVAALRGDLQKTKAQFPDVAGLKTELQKARKQISDVAGSLSRADASSKAAQAKLAALESAIRDLKTSKLDRSQLDKLSGDREARIADVDKKLRAQNQALEKRIAALERALDSVKASKQESARSSGSEDTAPRSTAKTTGKGKFQEQDLTH